MVNSRRWRLVAKRWSRLWLVANLDSDRSGSEISRRRARLASLAATMSPRVAVVTDSTSYLPTQVALDHHIRKVPVQVIVSGRAYSEGVDITTAEVAEALRDWQVVSTSRPSPADFLKAWGQAVEGGAVTPW